MDYIALHNPSAYPHGVFYNSKHHIGGVRYFEAEKKVVRKGWKSKEVIVYVDDKAKPKNKPRPQKKHRVRKVKPKIQIVDREAFKANSKQMTAQRLKEIENNLAQQLIIKTPKPEFRKPKPNIRIPQDYVVKINGKKINFTKQGIKRARFSSSDRAWLKKAQHYFITARENNRNIGSAEEYTSEEILEALWSTATTVGIDPKRFLVQIYNESRFNPNLKGKAGERGIGQFKKSTSQMLGYNWRYMKSGIRSYAYQARAAAEFIKQVGEEKYNGGGWHAKAYKRLIGNRLKQINKA